MSDSHHEQDEDLALVERILQAPEGDTRAIAGYTLNNQGIYEVDASDNYWGEDTETEMNAKGCDANIDTIYDRYDSASKGLVTYCDYAVDLGPVTCEQQIVGSGSIIDVSPDPAPSQPWFYLLRDHVTPGNCGLDSSGRERVPASGDCP